MGFSPCTAREDPFTRQIRSTYRASVVKVPRTGIDPLDALAVRARRVEPRGRLAAMIEGAAPAFPAPAGAKVSDLSGSRTTALDISLGLDLTASFLTALGVPIPSAKAAASLWRHAARITFEVRDVRSEEIDLAELGRVLAGRRLWRNPATDIFFTDPDTRLLVITRTLTSASFAVHSDGSDRPSAQLAVDGLKNLLGSADAGVSWQAEDEDVISFQGRARATFAFSAVPCVVRRDGSLIFGLARPDLTLGGANEPEPKPAPVVDESGLLSFDQGTPPTPGLLRELQEAGGMSLDGGPVRALPEPADVGADLGVEADDVPGFVPPPSVLRPSAPPPTGTSPAPLTRGEPTAAPVGPQTPGGVEPPSEPVPPAASRWINAELEDHDPNEPLQQSLEYTLAFDVDVLARQTAVGASRLADVPLFLDGVDEVTLTVQLDSDDFEISEPTRPLRLPRTGRSRGKARFEIKAKRPGRCFLSATIHHDRNFVQKMDLAVSVGMVNAEPVSVTSTGRPTSAAAALRKRDLMLVIEPLNGVYSCTVVADGVHPGRVTLEIKDDELADAVDTARQALMSVVNSPGDDGTLVFQTGLDIPEAQRQSALGTLARAGARLFQKIFLPNAASLDLKALAQLVRTLAGEPGVRLQLQVVTRDFPAPWGMLYLGDAREGAELSWDHFVGLRHLVEQLPLVSSFTPLPPDIVSDKPDLAVGLALNSRIDTDMGLDVVSRQSRFWADAAVTRSPLRVTTYAQRSDVVRALARDDNDQALIYFYCHATASTLGARGGLDASSLGLTDATVSLGDLNLDAPRDVQLKGGPLVFINACESAELSPLFYEGFVPYFMAKGARGVIGTECKMPALFAEAWAARFFDAFFSGAPLGETFLQLRQDFLSEHGNPLGLLYGVYCDADTRIAPALAAAIPAPAAPAG